MEADFNRLKRNIRISAIVTIIACSTLTISGRLQELRVVDFLHIFASGMAFGALLVNVILMRRLKK